MKDIHVPVCVFVPYFATWVPIITSPSFIRNLLKGLQRHTWNVVFNFWLMGDFVKIQNVSARHMIPFTSCKGRCWETELARAPLEQNGSKRVSNQQHTNDRCFPFLRVTQSRKNKLTHSAHCLMFKTIAEKHRLHIISPPSLASGSSSTFSSKSLSFGKPSKCLVRIHALACTMIPGLRAAVRDKALF